MEKPLVRRAAWLSGCLVILVGATLTGRSLYLRGEAALAVILIRKAWDEAVRTGDGAPAWQGGDTPFMAPHLVATFRPRETSQR